MTQAKSNIAKKPAVLVWQSYGTTRVHPCGTAGHLTAIIAEIGNIIADWGDDKAFDDMTRAVRMFVDRQNFTRAHNEIRSFCQRHSDHESFEVFEFCNIEELA